VCRKKANFVEETFVPYMDKHLGNVEENTCGVSLFSSD